MKKLILLILGLSSTFRAAALDLYVSPQGNDANAGTASAPFATITRARDAVRAIKDQAGLPAGGITVWLRGGYYPQTETLWLDGRDSGTAERPVVYASAAGEQAHLTGARALDPAWFSLVDSGSPVWARLDPAARGQLYSVDLRARGISDFGTLKPRGFVLRETAPLELFMNGEPMALGRWPNRGAALATTAGAPSSTQINYSGSRPERWSQAADPWLHGLWSQTWADFHVSVAGVDPASKTINLTSGPAQYGTAADRPYYAYNLLEEIDEPGEYYLDRSSGVLYFWPGGPLTGATILASMLETGVVRLESAQYLTLRNLVIEASRGPLLEIVGGDHNRVESSTLRNAGQFAARISGAYNGLDHCVISDCGEEGVRLAGGDRASLESGHNYVTNTEIRRTAAASWTYKPGINFEGGSGNIAAHNFLELMPHSAILFTGNNHLVEANEIAHVCQTTSDAGAIYSGHDWGYRGNVIRYNFIRNIATDVEGYGAHGVYLDDCVSGVEVYANIFYRVSNTAIFVGGGRDVIVRNNLVGLSGTAHHNDDRGRFRITDGAGDYWNLLERLGYDGIRYKEAPWATAFPACAAIPDSWDEIQRGLWRNPENCVFSGNAGWGNSTWTSEQNDSGTGVFAVYASFTNNHASVSAPFDENAALNRSARAATVSASVSGFTPIAFASIGPSAVVTSQAPLPPALTGAATGSFGVDLQWTADTTLLSGLASGFELEQRTEPAGAWQVIQNFGSQVSTAGVAALAPGTNYGFRLRAFNTVGSTYSNTVTIATPAVPTVPSGVVRVEAETPLTIVGDPGSNGTIGVAEGTLDSGQSVRLYDVGDTIRLAVPVATAGSYRLSLRVRAGGTTGATTFWPDGYRFKLDGAAFTAVGDPATVSALDPAYGGCYWGTMISAPVVLAAGVHTVELAAAANWAVADYVEIAPEGTPTEQPTTPPTVTVPANRTVDATGAAGAVVTFATSATDSAGRTLATTNTPASGSVFGVGTTTVTVSATDAAGRTATNTFTITVRAYVPPAVPDTAPPVITVPAPITVTAASTTGVVVTFTTSAVDVVSGTVATVNTPASGSLFPVGVTTVAVTARDNAGNAASAAFNITVLPPEPVIPVDSLDPVWASGDVGSVNLAGRASGTADALTVAGSGADIWDSAVGFRYVYRGINGDSSVIARVTSLQNTNSWAKAGWMFRETFDAAAPFAALYLTPGNGVALQWRATTGASCSSWTTGGSAPAWVRLDRAGHTFTAFTSADGTNWQQFASTTVTMGTGLYVGLAVTSHNAGVLATATFDGVRVTTGGSPTPAPATPPTITVPADFAVDATSAGGAVVSFATSALDSAGRALMPTSTPASGSQFGVGTTTVNVTATDDSGRSASKTFSITVRAYTPPTFADTTPPVINVPSPITAEATGAAGAVVSFTVSASDTGSGLASSTVSPATGAVFPLGTTDVVATARDVAGNVASKTFTVTVRDTTPPAIGVPANLTLAAANAFGATANFTTTATDAVAGAVATRNSPASGSIFPIGTTSVLVSANDNAGNAASATFTVTVLPLSLASPSGLIATSADSAVRLTWDAVAAATGYSVKRGDADGGPYATIASNVTTTSFDDSAVSNGSTYYYVVVAQSGAGVSGNSNQASATPAAGPVVAWTSTDVGTVNIAGRSSIAGEVFTVAGSGADIWDSNIGFHYVYRALPGDGSITARVTSLQYTDSWAKVGLMIRDTLAPEAPFAGLYLTPGNGVALQWRGAAGWSCNTWSTSGYAPTWLRLERAGNTFSASVSDDGANWRQFASVSVALGANVYVGLAVTSHNAGALNTATFEGVRTEGTVAEENAMARSAEFVPGAPVRVEAETAPAILNDAGSRGAVGISDGQLDSGQSVRLYDDGDAIRVSFPIESAGLYRISVRVRSGGTTGSAESWPDGYAFRLDGEAVTLTGDPATVSALDPAYGGCHWGTMVDEVRVLGPGLHAFDIVSKSSWAVADYVEITPLEPALAAVGKRYKFLAQQLAVGPRGHRHRPFGVI